MINHKDTPIPNFKDHIELKVGKLYNYTGDNINHLNPYINEATGLYHIWKHTKDEIVGLAQGQKQRTLGYLVEELLTFWCKEHNLKIYECKIREIDNL